MSLYDTTPQHATFVNDRIMTTNDALLIKILTADKGESYTMSVRSKYAPAIITEIKRLLKSRAVEYDFELHADGYLLITRL